MKGVPMNQSLFLAIILSLVASIGPSAARAATLEEAYASALATHESVQIAGENVVQAESRVDQAYTYLYPRITAYGSYTRYNDVLPPDGLFVFQPLNQTQASVVLTQPLYTGGRTLAALRLTKTQHESSRSELSSSRQTIMMNVAEAYYAVLRAQKTVAVSKEAVGRMLRHRQVTEREAATRRSKANTSALLRANSLVDQTRINLTLAENTLSVARKRLSLLTQLPDDAELVEPDPLQLPSEPLGTLQARALQSRDDYASARLTEKIAKENVTIVKGAHYPQIYAEGGVRYQDSSPETLMDATTYYGGVRIMVPIFEGGLMKAEVAEARSRQRQSELNAVLLQRTIRNEVTEAYLNCQTVNAVYETARAQFDSATRNFDAVEGLFAEGLTPSLSVIDAQQALTLVERELVGATYEQQLALVRLQKSMGLLGKQQTSGTR